MMLLILLTVAVLVISAEGRYAKSFTNEVENGMKLCLAGRIGDSTLYFM